MYSIYEKKLISRYYYYEWLNNNYIKYKNLYNLKIIYFNILHFMYEENMLMSFFYLFVYELYKNYYLVIIALI